jgi:hypothetical protein
MYYTYADVVTIIAWAPLAALEIADRALEALAAASSGL